MWDLPNLSNYVISMSAFLVFLGFLLVDGCTAWVHHSTNVALSFRWHHRAPLLLGRRLDKTVVGTVAATQQYANSNNAGVQVYDHVFTSAACAELHELAQDHAERGSLDGSSIFYYRGNHQQQQEGSPLTPLEAALNSVLHAIDDDSDDSDEKSNNTDDNDNHIVVEYWSRQEYLNLQTHADIDEEEFQDDGVLSCPDFGHVLYLDVDNKESNNDDYVTPRACPTVVFPTKLGGWGMDDTTTGSEGAIPITTTTRAESSSSSSSGLTPMVIVPAVSGRVLRFPGSAMHAVPKPASRWMLSLKEQQEYDETDDDDNDDDDDDDEAWEYYDKRSVILFNIWKGRGPRGIPQDYTTGILPEGIELDVDDDTYLKEQQALRVKEWTAQYGTHYQNICCQPKQHWKKMNIEQKKQHDNDNDKAQLGKDKADRVIVPLMGNAFRRQYSSKSVRMNYHGGSQMLEEALLEKSQPSKIQFTEHPLTKDG